MRYVLAVAKSHPVTIVGGAVRPASFPLVRHPGGGQGRDHLADVRVHLPVRAQRIIDQLQQCGYTITDRKTGQPTARLPKR